jgi:arylsulfatase
LTPIKDEIRGQRGLGQSPYHDGLMKHDHQVGALLDKLDELGIADNTIPDAAGSLHDGLR